MLDTDEPYIRSSQEPIISFSDLSQLNDEHLRNVMSTQELNLIQSQEAMEAMEYLYGVAINSSQESVSAVVAMNDNSDGEQSNLSFACSTVTATESRSSQMEDNVDSPLKKRRGRKRKVWTPGEWETHQKKKREKNRIAAKRLRQRKGEEVNDCRQTEQTLAEKIRLNKECIQNLNNKCLHFRRLIGKHIPPES